MMSLSGGLMAGYIVSKGNPFWTFSCGLCGIIAASAGNDLYHPVQALLIGAIVPVIVYKLHYWVERRFKIDDAVGAAAVHGYGGFSAWSSPVSCCGGSRPPRMKASRTSIRWEISPALA